MIKNKRLILLFSLLALLAMACNLTGLIDRVDVPGGVDPEEDPAITTEAVEQADEPTVSAESNTPAPGETLDNPAPVGVEVVADNKAFVVLSATRPADEIVAEANSFNEEAGSGEEYLLVEFQFTCVKESGEQCSFHPFNVLTYGSLEEKHTVAFVAGLENEHESVDFNSGETISGVMPFLVGQEETDLVLVYQPFSGGAYFFEVPE